MLISALYFNAFVCLSLYLDIIIGENMNNVAYDLIE